MGVSYGAESALDFLSLSFIHCVIGFVALDGVEGKPAAVPPWQLQEGEDKRLADCALRLMPLSKDIEQAVASLRQA